MTWKQHSSGNAPPGVVAPDNRVSVAEQRSQATRDIAPAFIPGALKTLKD
jgi:hypothetical protein